MKVLGFHFRIVLTLFSCIALAGLLLGCAPESPGKVLLQIRCIPGEGGTVQTSPMPEADGKYKLGTRVVIDARSAPGYTFVRWSKDAQGTFISETVTMDCDKVIFAEFIKDGSGTAPASVPPTTPPPTSVVAKPPPTTQPPTAPPTPTPSPAVSPSPTVPPPTTTPPTPSPKPTVTYFVLNVSSSPASGGSVSPGSGTYQSGQQANLTASPASGYEFSGWSGDVSGSSPSTAVLMDSDKDVTASFRQVVQRYTLSVQVNGSGSVNPSGGTYDSGTQVTLSATPATGYAFDHWSGDASGNATTATVTMSASRSVAAYFTEIPSSARDILFVSRRVRSQDVTLYSVKPDGTGLERKSYLNNSDHMAAWSKDGKKIAFANNQNGTWEIYTMNANGSGVARLTQGTNDGAPTWSHDSTKIAFDSSRNGNSQIYVMNADGSAQTPMTDSYKIGKQDSYPSWSPKANRIAFFTNRDGNWEIYVMNVDGSGQLNLSNNASDDTTPNWSPDGTKIVFSSNRSGNFNIYTMNADGSNVVRLTNTSARDECPSWSPDGKQIVFQSNRDGNSEIYVMNADGTNQRNISNFASDDWHPAWTR